MLGAAFSAGAEEQHLADWWPTVSEKLVCSAKAEEGNAVLRVELQKPDEKQIKELKDADGSVTGYSLNGKKLPERFWPGCTLIKKFDLQWDGKKIDIPERFWADLAGLRIQESSLNLEKLSPDSRFEGEKFLAQLDRPRVYISADGGTLLIEWGRPEECDGHSTIRWIISKSGTILRHRHTPPHEC